MQTRGIEQSFFKSKVDAKMEGIEMLSFLLGISFFREQKLYKFNLVVLMKKLTLKPHSPFLKNLMVKELQQRSFIITKGQ